MKYRFTTTTLIALVAIGSLALPALAQETPITQHHADVIAAECVTLDDGIGIAGVAASWLQTGGPGSGNPDIRILFDDVEVASGAFTEENGYQFSFGPIVVTGPGPVAVTAFPAADFDNGTRGDPRTVSVSLDECQPQPTTTTTTTITTSTTTSTVPPTTLPPTTVPETTLPPTTVPETTIPDEFVNVALSCDWDNRDAQTGAHEPIGSDWDSSPNIEYGDYWFAYVVYDRLTGDFIGSTEFGMTSNGFHDSWVSDPTIPVPTDGFIVHMLKNDEPWQILDDPTCIAPPTTSTVIIDPPPVTEPEPVCVEDDTSSTGWRWVGGENDGDECLPHTGPIPGETIAYQGSAADDLRAIGVGALVMLGIAGLSLAAEQGLRRRKQRATS